MEIPYTNNVDEETNTSQFNSKFEGFSNSQVEETKLEDLQLKDKSLSCSPSSEKKLNRNRNQLASSEALTRKEIWKFEDSLSIQQRRER
jgi:hypothetical protein